MPSSLGLQGFPQQPAYATVLGLRHGHSTLQAREQRLRVSEGLAQDSVQRPCFGIMTLTLSGNGGSFSTETGGSSAGS